MENKRYIDLYQIIKTKNKKLARILYWTGLLWIVHRIIHNRWLNRGYACIADLEGMEAVKAGIDYLKVNIVIDPKSFQLPSDGRYIILANHPLGGLDAIAFLKVFGEKYKVKIPANDILMNIAPLAPLMLPVNKQGRQSRELAKGMDEIFASKDIQFLNFAAGLCSRKIDGKIQDLEWKTMPISRAIDHHRDIVPVNINGRNSGFFYWISNVRKKLGLPNIEMILLPHEMHRQRGKTLTFTIGEPIPWDTFDESKDKFEWAQWVRQKCYDLAPKKN